MFQPGIGVYSRRMSRVARLSIVLGFNLLLVIALIGVGLTAHSLGVLAAGADYLADASVIAISILAIWVSKRPPTTRRPDGYPRATAIAALITGGWLLVLSVLVAIGAIDRLTTGTPVVDGLPVLIVSAVAAVVMGIGVVILRGDSGGDNDEGATLTMRAVVLDTVADASIAAGVAATGTIILVSGRFYWLDPAVALVITVVVGYHAVVLLRDVVDTLRGSTTVVGTD